MHSREQPPDVRARKAELRARLLADRRRLSAGEREEAAAAVCAHVLALPEVAEAARVSAYASIGAEVGTATLIESLRSTGRRVLLPVVLPDLDLDWAEYSGPESLARVEDGAVSGLREPSGTRLGRDVVAGVDVLIVPGVAADRTGRRLGRGGGSYDRALARVPVGRLVAVILYDHELVDEVPAATHDRPVDVVITPSGPFRVGVGGS